MDFAKFKIAVQRANDSIERWSALQEAASKLLSNAGNILQRLPVLSDARNFVALPQAKQLQQLVLAKQLRALEAVFGRLQANLAELENVVRVQERLVVEAWRLLGEAPSAVGCGTVQPGGASVAQLVESIEDVWRICRDDLAVRAAALAGLSYATSPQRFAEIHEALKSCMALLPAGSGWSCTAVVLLQSIAAAFR
ncbi:hypothetical protein Vretimale_448 [Volvox reticuliferus]|uniref:Uncharacterized protein n=1 Tax=Volvox reticuliferus TaxID=1737510 RepID=A0A8J4D8D4_9CHLO|nr:hypothetical protein Vretifemale_2628 [Volvox reticuliferus]GIL94109.1 hypothetical protein Vretimale_448 [Volvox reticuliferus]